MSHFLSRAFGFFPKAEKIAPASLDRTHSKKCGVCGGTGYRAFTAVVLARHQVDYFYCQGCQYLQTESPYWLSQAYTSAISRADTGIVVRNLQIARTLIGILDIFFPSAGRFLDSAGGTGLMTRLMRDAGYDFYWEDAYCANALAGGFEAPPDMVFDAVTAFEAIEHMPDPVAFVRDAMARSATGTLIFTTELFESGPPPQDWWYYAFATGQHISFFTRETLRHIAIAMNANLVSAGGMHMITRLPVSQWRYARVVRSNAKIPYELLRNRRRSLTETDHRAMLEASALT